MRDLIREILRESDWGWVSDFNPILETGKWSIGYIDNLLKEGYIINFKYPNGINPNVIYSIVNEYGGMYEVSWLSDYTAYRKQHGDWRIDTKNVKETITYEKEDAISILNSQVDPWIVTSIEPKDTLKESSDFGWVDETTSYDPAELLNNALGYEKYGDKWKVTPQGLEPRTFFWIYKYNDNSGEYDPVTYFPLPKTESWVDNTNSGTRINKDIDGFLRWVVSALETQLKTSIDFAKEKDWSENTVGMLRIRKKQELLNALYDVGFNIKEGLNESDLEWVKDVPPFELNMNKNYMMDVRGLRGEPKIYSKTYDELTTQDIIDMAEEMGYDTEGVPNTTNYLYFLSDDDLIGSKRHVLDYSIKEISSKFYEEEITPEEFEVVFENNSYFN